MAAPYYVTHNAGGGGVGTEGDPYTMAEACDNVAAGETVYVKASGVYEVEDGANDCVIHPTVTGTVTSPILFQGYKTTINDGGIVRINADPAGDQFTSALKVDSNSVDYIVFKNFEFYGGSTYGVNTNGGDFIVFKNCSAHDNGSYGFSGDNDLRCENCTAYSNGIASGYDSDSAAVYFSCVSHTNGTIGFEANGGLALGCLSYNNSGVDVNLKILSTEAGCVVGCTMDAEGNDDCVDLDSGAVSTAKAVVFNNIFRDPVTPINADADSGELVLSGRNLYDAKDNDNTNFLAVSTGTGSDGSRGDIDGTDANLFENEAGDDYELKTTATASTALVKGLDAHYTVKFWAEYNEGAENPPVE